MQGVFCFHARSPRDLCMKTKHDCARSLLPCHPKTPPTAEQWAHIVGMLEGAHAGSPAAQSACGQTEAKRDMGLRTNLYGATQGEDHAQAGVDAATPTSSNTACGRFCRGDSAAGPPYSDSDLVPHEEPRAFDPKIPDLAGASRRLPAAQQVSAGTSRCLASGYTSVCALRSQLDPSRTRPPLWLRAFVSTEVSRCSALPRVSLYPSTVILGTGAPRIVVPFPACASPSM
jgi:hypothetical protein